MTVKYPKTWHAPWSDSMSSDDHWHTNMDHLKGRRVKVREKMDGECTTCYWNGNVHARSQDSASHISQSYARRELAGVAHNLPTGWRVCCENVYALHSIYYHDLPGYTFVLNVWDENNNCLSDTDTQEIAKDMGLPTPPLIYDGIYDEAAIRAAWTGTSAFQTYTARSYRPLYEALADKKSGEVDLALCEPTTGEGYVIRIEDAFPYAEFDKALAKYVREGHVQTSKFWRNEIVIPNGVRCQ